MIIRHYNIHDIYKFTINDNSSCKLFDILNSDFSYFEEINVENPDLVLNIGEFTPQNHDCYIIDNKYHIKDDYIFCTDSIGKYKWMTEISGFESGKIVINFKILSRKTIFDICLPLYTYLLEGFLMYSLSFRGYHTIHSAAVCKNDDVFLLAGRGGSFKTSLVMDLIRKEGFSYMSDDKTIIHDNYAFAYPLNLNRFVFMLENMEFEKYKNKLEKLNLIKHLLTSKKQAINKNKQIIKNDSSIKKLIFVSKTLSPCLKISKISGRENIVQKLIENNRLELCLHGSHLPSLTKIKTNPFYRYMDEYSYVFPKSNVGKYWSTLEEGLTEIFDIDEVYEIQFPNNYDVNDLAQIHDLLYS
ncbi:hypothetical protein HNV12_07870 [Methanococcoides sp. SA1]|nr:hypothetical protein [Methanococcoides sp. SA1]